jgi:molybdopterin-guanine dinucleotide biosynthesis protein A
MKTHGDSAPSSTSPPQLGAVILAGGEAVRLSEKCFRTLGRKPLIVHVFEKISHVTQNIVIATRTPQQQSRLKTFLPNVSIVLDEKATQSPLTGFFSGMRGLETAYVFAAPCDAPFIEPDLIRVLFERARGYDCAIPAADGGMEPLIAVYDRLRAISAAASSLEQGKVSLHDMLARLDRLVKVPKESLRLVDPELLSFLNVNTELELLKAEQILRASKA